jgi:hypothetical protein
LLAWGALHRGTLFLTRRWEDKAEEPWENRAQAFWEDRVLGPGEDAGRELCIVAAIDRILFLN